MCTWNNLYDIKADRSEFQMEIGAGIGCDQVRG